MFMDRMTSISMPYGISCGMSTKLLYVKATLEKASYRKESDSVANGYPCTKPADVHVQLPKSGEISLQGPDRSLEEHLYYVVPICEK